jgi:acetyltransferase-like isoleucine patch superfamily enzyme
MFPIETLGACGLDVTIWDRAHIPTPERMFVGNAVIVDDFVFIMPGGRVVLGDFVHVASFVSVLGGGELIVDDFAGISSGVRIYTGTDDFVGGGLTGPTVPAELRAPVRRGTVHIGKHAVIGANSVVLPGVTIGEGATVGALSLVNADLEPWTVYAGSPARPVKQRDKQSVLSAEVKARAMAYDDQGNYLHSSKWRREVPG